MYTLSIILNLHKERELITKTILNLRDILLATHNWEEIEVIAILDNSDEMTSEIIHKNSDLFDQIEEVNYKDLGNSRNHGVQTATKNFILFADGDDYCSNNILQAVYNVFYAHYSNIDTNFDNISEYNHIAIFPEYLIEFPNLFHMHYVNSNKNIVQNNRFVHCYHSKIAINKQILLKYPMQTNHKPYGYEDWDLNNRLLALGIQYKIAEYKLYYRKNQNHSLLSKQIERKNIVRNSDIYTIDKIQQITNVEIPKINSINSSFDVFKATAQSNTLQTIYQELLFEEDKLFLESYGEEISYREDTIHFSTSIFASELSSSSIMYNKLLEFFYAKNVLYFFPWIGLGGADKVSIEYTKALVDKNSCVITSISMGARISAIEVPHLDLKSELDGWELISEENQLNILMKAIINSGIKLVHIVNSDIALKTIKFYSEIYQEYNIKTIVTLFCPDYDWVKKQYHGYPVIYPEVFINADLILSDNNHWYPYFKQLNNNNDFIFKKIASPTDEIKMTYHHKRKITKKILWASRICNQKLFNVFEEIVFRLNDYCFIIYGDMPVDGANQQILNRLITKDNVEYRGEYHHISELELNEFDLYLFTSLFEGIPTIILDMIMVGIPIISANVGGISEVLGNDYPLLVNNQTNANDYIEKIKLYYDIRDLVSSNMINIRENMATIHNKNHFKYDYNTIIKEVLNGRG